MIEQFEFMHKGLVAQVTLRDHGVQEDRGTQGRRDTKDVI